MTKRLADAYDPRIRWLTVKNPDYSQQGEAICSIRQPGGRSFERTKSCRALALAWRDWSSASTTCGFDGSLTAQLKRSIRDGGDCR